MDGWRMATLKSLLICHQAEQPNMKASLSNIIHSIDLCCQFITAKLGPEKEKEILSTEQELIFLADVSLLFQCRSRDESAEGDPPTLMSVSSHLSLPLSPQARPY